MIFIGVDTGGTFTDFIYRDGGEWGVYKLLSTPSDPAAAVLAGIRHIAGSGPVHIVHGSTVATNAILERKGAVTALVTNRGFEDIIELGRQYRGSLYDLAYRKAPHIVPHDLRFGIECRVIPDGTVLEGMNDESAARVARQVADSGAESVAVCFLFSFVNPGHETRMGELLERLGMQVSLSHQILGEFREFERTSTTVVNAYVAPRMKGYLSNLLDSLDEKDRLSIMQSNGGSISAHAAMREPVRTILSGPAGGVVGAFEAGRMSGFTKLVTFDMGGTSTDVSLLDGAVSLTFESSIGGYPVKVPMIDIHTVGAGGGSIAFLDAGGALRVGPESAGADPGPICYGRGTRITVTDANLYLGRLVPEYFLGGQMRLHPERLEPVFRKMSAAAELSPRELAEGILSVVNSSMEKALRVISIERGHNPQEFTLLSFGGAGGMHAAFLARLLSIPRVVVPRHAGILSAMGMLIADIVKDYSRTIMLRDSRPMDTNLEELFGLMETRAWNDLDDEGVRREAVFFQRSLDMRYRGQSYEITVPFAPGYVEEFHRLHERMYGYGSPERPVEIVNVRLRAGGAREGIESDVQEKVSTRPDARVFQIGRPVVFDSKVHDTRIVDRSALRAGDRIAGPALVVEYSSTVVVPPFAKATVDGCGNLLMDIS